MKKLSKKNYLIISGSMIALLLVSVVVTGVIKASDKQPDILYREYPVSRGDITAGINSVGSLSLNAIDHKFETDVMINEVFIKQGQVVKKGDPIASLLTTEIEEKIKELEQSLVAANLSLEQAKNNKTITVLNQENGWKATTDQSKEQYETEKSEAQKNIQSLENRVKDLQAQIDQKNEKIKNLTDLIQQEQAKPDEEQQNPEGELPLKDEEQQNPEGEQPQIGEEESNSTDGQLEADQESLELLDGQ
ncbi:MAG: biotin/lipoyl-binding protein, partial [Turicibacter sp.]